jgi:putative ABC transport system permease protein
VSSGPRWRRYLRLVRANVVEDVDEELTFHIAMRTERNIALGMSPNDARRDALARFGDVSLVRDFLMDHDTRKERAEGRREFFADFAQDFRFGWRALRRAPTFALAAALTLAVGIGANAAIFSVLDAIVLRPLPYAQPEQLVHIGQGSGGELVALRERLRSVSQLGAFVVQTHPIDDGEQSIRTEGAAVTPNLFSLLGVFPALGRSFTEHDGILGNNNVLLLSHGLWQRRFGGSRDIVGRTLLLEGTQFTVVGVMPPDFHFPDKSAQYWQPYAFNERNPGIHWAVGGKEFIGRLRPGVTLAQASREVRDVWPTMRRLNPLWDPGDRYGRNATARPMQDAVVGSTAKILWLLFGSVFLILLIGCVNVANLLLARATARQRELSVRAALGGGRGRLVRQLITESLLLSLVGGALGIVLAYLAVEWLVAVLPAGVPRSHEIAVRWSVIAFTGAVAIGTTLLFGMIPALRATRVISPSLMSSGQRGTAGTHHQRVAGALVGLEVAFAVMLVIGSALLVRSFLALRNVDPGFRTERVIAARVTPPGTGYREPARVSALYSTVLDRMRSLGGVQRVAAVDRLPLAQIVWGAGIRVQGQFEDASKLLPSIGNFQQVTPDYFATLGMSVRGRTFTDTDREGQPGVVIVSESVARQFWPNEDAVGRRLGYPWGNDWLTIVGVVPDVKQDSLRDTLNSAVYAPWEQRTPMSGSEMWVLARTDGDPLAVASAIRSIVAEIDRSVAVGDIRTMDSVVSDSVQKARFTTLLVGAFAIIALILGAIGIYGVMSYLVGQRAREMGIRLALGARPEQVRRLVVKRAVGLAGAGAAVGVVAAFFASRALQSLLYEVSATDPLSFIAVPALFIVVAIAASYSPARRATRVDPGAALRAD